MRSVLVPVKYTDDDNTERNQIFEVKFRGNQSSTVSIFPRLAQPHFPEGASTYMKSPKRFFTVAIWPSAILAVIGALDAGDTSRGVSSDIAIAVEAYVRQLYIPAIAVSITMVHASARKVQTALFLK